MKHFILFTLSIVLLVLAFVSCIPKDQRDHVNLSVDELHAEKSGFTETVRCDNIFGFYLIKEQGDTIYWVTHPSYQEKSELKGYEFVYENGLKITGNNMTLEKLIGHKFQIHLGPNPYNEQRLITIIVEPLDGENGRMDSLKIIQDY